MYEEMIRIAKKVFGFLSKSGSWIRNSAAQVFGKIPSWISKALRALVKLPAWIKKVAGVE